ncbi:MAG: TIGR02587 family membrane protein [Armatimonadetes bacterium]|nr:TIGR02587 family membrane protein [Armatimonadota bacterium]
MQKPKSKKQAQQSEPSDHGNKKPDQDDPHGWKREGRDLLQGLAAGVIFGMPLLYTMEMWWHGITLSPAHLLILLGVILAVNFVFSLFSGFREEFSFFGALSEAITSVGIGILVSILVLWLIGQFSAQQTLIESVGKVLIEAVAVSIGVSFANSQVAGKSRTGEEGQGGGTGQGKGKSDGPQERQEDKKELSPERRQLKADLEDIGATLAGSMLLAFSVAPTEEIILIAVRLTPWGLFTLLIAELIFCYIILFASGFQKREVYMKDSVFQKPWAETCVASALSLTVAGGLYWLIGFQGQSASLPAFISATVSLGLPAVVGGAAGRLIA